MQAGHGIYAYIVHIIYKNILKFSILPGSGTKCPTLYIPVNWIKIILNREKKYNRINIVDIFGVDDRIHWLMIPKSHFLPFL